MSKIKELHKIYNPIIATPFKRTDTYMEYKPCEALQPYIRCYWGTRQPVIKKIVDNGITDIVIPDTCMDIMFTVDLTNGKVNNNFCGIDDKVMFAHDYNVQEKEVFRFAIRFYGWGVHSFAEETLRDVKGTFFDVGYHFSAIKKEIEPLLYEFTDMYQLIPRVEQILLKHLKERKSEEMLQAVYLMLCKKGNISVGELSGELYTGERQLERLFREYIGVSPKSLAAMIRYQYLWNDIVYMKRFNYLEAVMKYGYSDQTHLCHDFKKFHSMNITEAREYAYRMSEIYNA